MSIPEVGLVGGRRFGGGEIAGAPHVPAGDGSPGAPTISAAEQDVGFGEVGGGDFVGGFEFAEGEREAFADGVVVDGEDVGAAEAKDEEHLDGPFTDAPDLCEVLDDLVVREAADLGEGGDGAVDGFCGEVAEGEAFVVREAGGAELFVGGFEEVYGGGMLAEAGDRSEAFDEAGVDGGGGFAVKLLVEDGADERLEGRLGLGEAEVEGSGAGDEATEFGVGGRERPDGLVGVVRRAAGSERIGHLAILLAGRICGGRVYGGLWRAGGSGVYIEVRIWSLGVWSWSSLLARIRGWFGEQTTPRTNADSLRE